MKKVKIIFPDGSVGEVDEADVKDALAAGAKLYTDKSVAAPAKQKSVAVTFADGSTGSIDEADYESAIASGSVKKKDGGTSSPIFGGDLRSMSGISQSPISSQQPEVSVNPNDNLSRNINALGGGSLKAVNNLPTEVIPIDDKYAPIFDVITKARPNEPEVRGSLYNQIVGDFESGEEPRVKRAQTEIIKLKDESNPEVLTPADKTELLNLTGTDDPSKQLQVLDARLGKQTEAGDITGMVLNPLVGVDIANLPAADAEKLAIYRNKLAVNSDPQQQKNTYWSNKNVLTKGGEQTSEFDKLKNLLSGVAGISNMAVEEAKRYNSEKLTDSYSTGLESIKFTDPARYKKNKEAIEQGKPLSTTDVVDLTAVGTKIIQRQNSQDIVDGKIDADAYMADQEDLAKTQEQNVYGHPDFLRTIMADVIGKHYERDGTLAFSKWMITDKEIDAVPDSEYLAQGIDPNHPEVKKQKEFLKQKEGWFPFQNSIAKDDLFREFKKGATQPLKGIVSTVESIAGDVIDAEDALLLDNQTQQFGTGNVANQRGKYFDENYGKYADAFSGFGQFTSQLALMYAGGQAATAIGEGLGGGTVAARLLGASKMEKLGNLLVDNAQLYGTYGTSFVQSYGDYFKDALSKGADPLQAKMMAFTNASMEGVSETIFDNVKFGKEVAKNLLDKRNYDKIAKVFDRGVWDELSQRQYRDIVNDVASQTWKTFKTVTKAGGAAAKESFEEVPVAMANFVVDAAANPSNVKGRDVLLEAKDAFMDGLVSFSIPSLLGLAGGLRQQLASEKSANESLMIAAMQQPYVTESINRLVQAGEITQEQANQKLKVVNTAAQELQRMPKVDANDKELTPAERETYLSLSVKEKILENSLQDNDKAAQKVINGKINDILAKKDAILNKTVEDVVAAAPALFERAKSALIAKQESKEDNEGNRLQLESFKNATEEDVMTGAIQQAVDAPESAVSQFNGDRALVTDLIAQNDEQTINDSIKKWQDRAKSFVPAGNTEEEQTASFNEMNKDVKLNLAALREGLAKKQVAATTETVAPPSTPSKEVADESVGELTVAEKNDWSGLSMEDKRKLATENLPEAKTDMTDKEIVELADSNAKVLLAKMRGENISRPVELNPNLPEGYKLPGQTEESKPETKKNEPVQETNTEPAEEESEQKEEQFIPEVKKFEHPAMENPVYKVTVGGKETFIQRSEGMRPSETAWHEVKKDGKGNWVSARGTSEFLGFTKKEAIDRITADVKAEKEAAKPAKPKVRVSAEQVESGQPQQEKDAVPEGEYNTFVDKGVVTAERLNSIADKVMAQEQLSGREMEMLSAKTSEVNDELKRRFAEAAKEKVKEDFTPEERTKLSDALFAFADKILKADITGSGGGSAMTNLFKIPQEILGRAIQAVALAVKGKETIVEALKKGIEIIRAEKYQVDENDFAGLVQSVMAGEKPKMGRVRPPSFSTMASIPSSKEYEAAMDEPEKDDPIAAYHMTRAADLPKMFGADKTQQNVFDSLPSDERFRAQMDMIQDGKALMAAAQSMFGSTDVLVYGPQLLAYINRGKEIDAGLTNKRAVMLATLLGEVKQDLLTNKNPDRQDALQQFDKRLSTVYNQFMHVTAKNLSAARLLRVFRDKYMADIFHDKILEEQQIRERDNLTEEEADIDISDADALAHQEKPREKPDVKAQAAERKQKQAEADKRKKSPKNEFDKKASELESDIKKKYGGKNKLIENVIDRIKKLNCK